jgi:hypothetical protein
MSLQIFNVDLIGPTFTIQTDESLDYMQSLVMRLRERLGSLKESTRVSDPLRLSVLLSITLMDELQRARERSLEGGVALDSGDEEEFASITARLIADLDRSLEGPPEAVLVQDAPDRVK